VLKHYLFIDYATQAYLLMVAVLVLLFSWRNDPALAAADLGAPGGCLAAALADPGDGARAANAALSFLRHFYPILLYAGFYREVGELNQMFVSGVLDHHVIRFDQWLFGFQPVLT